MTDQVKHECGIAVIRLLKPLEYYYNKYGTWQYGLDKLYLLMENSITEARGAGLGAVKLEAPSEMSLSLGGHWDRVLFLKYFPTFMLHSYPLRKSS